MAKINGKKVLSVVKTEAVVTSIDTEMSDTSTNAVQNKVIKAYVDSHSGGSDVIANPDVAPIDGDLRRITIDGLTYNVQNEIRYLTGIILQDSTLVEDIVNPLAPSISNNITYAFLVEFSNTYAQVRFRQNVNGSNRTANISIITPTATYSLSGRLSLAGIINGKTIGDMDKSEVATKDYVDSAVDNAINSAINNSY